MRVQDDSGAEVFRSVQTGATKDLQKGAILWDIEETVRDTDIDDLTRKISPIIHTVWQQQPIMMMSTLPSLNPDL